MDKNIYVVELVFTDDEDDRDKFSKSLQRALAKGGFDINTISIKQYPKNP